MTLGTRALAALATAALALGGLTATVPAAHAADNGAWSVTPTPPADPGPTPRTYFVLEGAPGQLVTDKVRIKNFTDEPITFEVYGADGFNTPDGGFFALQSLGEPQVDVGAWVSLPVQEVEVAGRTQTDVPFNLQIPANATPGDHVGGIVALNTAVEATNEEGSFDLGLQRAVAARLYLRVAGPAVPSVSVTDVRIDTDRGLLPWTGSDRGSVTLTIANDGNLRLAPQADIAVTGLFGRELATIEREAIIDLLPGQTATVTEEVDGIGLFDRVTATVRLSTEEGITAERAASVWVLPWLAVLLLLLVVGAAAWWVHRRRTAARRHLAAAAAAPRLTVRTGG